MLSIIIGISLAVTTCVVRRTYSNSGRTDVSRPPAQGCGTAFQLVLDKRTSAMNSLSGC